MAKLYRNYLDLLKKWPVDPAKKRRDLAVYLRNRVQADFRTPNELSGSQNEEECSKTFASLNRLVNNTYQKQFERQYSSSATGLNASQCRAIVSDEFMDLIRAEESRGGFLNRFWRTKE